MTGVGEGLVLRNSLNQGVQGCMEAAYIISKGFGDRLDPSSSERDIEAKLEFKAAAANELTLNLPGEITWKRNKAERKSGQMPDSGRLSGKIMAYKQIVRWW